MLVLLLTTLKLVPSPPPYLQSPPKPSLFVNCLLVATTIPSLFITTPLSRSLTLHLASILFTNYIQSTAVPFLYHILPSLLLAPLRVMALPKPAGSYHSRLYYSFIAALTVLDVFVCLPRYWYKTGKKHFLEVESSEVT